MAAKEATARVKINKLLEAAGWRFFPEDGRAANIRLDFLLLDARGSPLIGKE
jgi:type I restriction enzyme, R subunit